MSHPDDAQKRSGLSRFGELGPVWITALTGLIVALTGAGFFVGRATGTSSAPPTATPTITATQQILPVKATTSTPPQGGQELGSYSVRVPPSTAFPLSYNAPTQSQFIPGDGPSDLFLDTGGTIGYHFYPKNGSKIVLLPGGSTPTYQSCSQATGFVGRVANATGTAFCLIEPTGKLAGVSVTAIDPSAPYETTIGVTVWQNPT